MLQRLAEVREIDVAIGDQQKLRQRQLPFTEDAKGAGHRLSPVPLLHDRRGEGMVTSLPVRPEASDGRHDQRKERREQLLEQVSDEEIFLPRLTNHRSREDGVASVGQTLHLEDRIVVLQRVVAVVIAERALRLPKVWRNLAHQRELRSSDDRVGTVAVDLR